MFKGKKVLLLEAAPNKRFDKLPERLASRTCALSASSVRLLASMYVNLSLRACDDFSSRRAPPLQRFIPPDQSNRVWSLVVNMELVNARCSPYGSVLRQSVHFYVATVPSIRNQFVSGSFKKFPFEIHKCGCLLSNPCSTEVLGR